MISESRVPRPRRVTESVAQSTLVRDWPQLSGEISQCGSLEDEISMFDKVGESNGDMVASRIVCRSRSQTTEQCGTIQDLLPISTDSELAQILFSYGRNHQR